MVQRNTVLILLTLISCFETISASESCRSAKDNTSDNSGLIALEKRTPTDQFALGSEFFKKQALDGDMINYLPSPIYSATLRRSLISNGNTARLRHVMKKAQDGEPVVIGFIGGSITQGAGSSDPSNRYADHVKRWWVENFPDSDITYINAGIGGTPSRYGVFRAESHLLRHEPDFVLIEFAVNDTGLDAETVPYMEGLIRQSLKQENDPAVMLLFMMTSKPTAEANTKPWQAMNGNHFIDKDTAYGLNVQNYQIPLGRHYDLPMISFRDAAFPLTAKGFFKWHEIISDKVHPNNFGHAFAGEMVTKYLETIRKQLPGQDSLPPIPEVPESFETDRYENIYYAEFQKENTTSCRMVLTPKEKFSPSNRGYQSTGNDETAKLEITFTGSNFYLCATTHKTFGSLTCRLLNIKGNVINEWTGSYKSAYEWYIPRISPVFSDLEPGSYKVEIETNDRVEIVGAGVVLDR